MMAGHCYYTYGLLWVTVVAALALLVGYRAKYAIVLVWIMVTSIQLRNPGILHGGDDWTRVLLFFAMFLPLDRVWAIRPSNTSSGTGAHPTRRAVLTTASFAHWAVVCSMYVRNWMGKRTGICWSQDHCGVRNGFGDVALTSPMGTWLRDQSVICSALTMLTMMAEGPVPLLAWLVPAPRVRSTALLSIIGMHSSFVILFYLGSFPIICIAGLVALLPGGVWDTVLPTYACLSLCVRRLCVWMRSSVVCLSLSACLWMRDSASPGTTGAWLIARHGLWRVWCGVRYMHGARGTDML